MTAEKNDRYLLLNHNEMLLDFWLTWECIYNFHLKHFGDISSFPFNQGKFRAIFSLKLPLNITTTEKQNMFLLSNFSVENLLVLTFQPHHGFGSWWPPLLPLCQRQKKCSSTSESSPSTQNFSDTPRCAILNKNNLLRAKKFEVAFEYECAGYPQRVLFLI